jgi:hypothetical protein
MMAFMTASLVQRLATAAKFGALALATLPLGAAAWSSCDGVPVRPAVRPIVLRPNGCSFPDLSSPAARSIAILAREGSVWWSTQVTPPNSADPCLITHGDGTWDVALVSPGVIDGRAGRTITKYDHCPDSQIYEADIMVDVGLDFTQADQRRFIARPANAGSGRHSMLHEYGHALGLEHDGTAFGVMRPSAPSPMGGHTNSGSPHYFFADDAFGLLQLGRIPREVPNFWVSAQVLRTDGSIANGDTDPTTGAPLTNPLPVRTRQIIAFGGTVGVHDWWGRTVALRAYADSSDVCTPLAGVGTTLAVVVVPLSKFATGGGVIMATIPPMGPSGQVLNVHLAGTLIPAPFQKPETRSWDDCATTGLKLITP